MLRVSHAGSHTGAHAAEDPGREQVKHHYRKGEQSDGDLDHIAGLGDYQACRTG